jgi:hypothetical protein
MKGGALKSVVASTSDSFVSQKLCNSFADYSLINTVLTELILPRSPVTGKSFHRIGLTWQYRRVDKRKHDENNICSNVMLEWSGVFVCFTTNELYYSCHLFAKHISFKIFLFTLALSQYYCCQQENLRAEKCSSSCCSVICTFCHWSPAVWLRPSDDSSLYRWSCGRLKYEGYSESNLRWAVNKTMRKNLLYLKNTYILKLLLNVVTAGIEALVVLGIKFCMPVSKKSVACELSHVSTSSVT